MIALINSLLFIFLNYKIVFLSFYFFSLLEDCLFSLFIFSNSSNLEIGMRLAFLTKRIKSSDDKKGHDF